MSKIVTIGNATLHLGDCRDILPTLTVDAVVTDPPYGINAKLGMGGGTKGDGGMWKGVRIAGDLDTATRDEALTLAAAPFAAFAKWDKPQPPNTRTAVVWDKGEHTGAGDLALPWKPNFDVVFIGGDGWSWSRRGSGVVRVNAVAGCVADRNDGHRFHPFEKPIGIMAHFVERAPGSIIVDPFMGSGTTGLACLKLGRKFVGIEIDPEFFDVACRRIEDAVRQPDMFVASSWDDMWREPFDETSAVTPRDRASS